MFTFLRKNKILLFLTCVFLLTRLLFLTKLPVFNDEAIYIDWGWRMTHFEGLAYLSLYDGKQPLLMWIFGISQDIFYDQLWASRLVSVVASIASFIGIYVLTKDIFNKKTGLYAAFLYTVSPLFIFYDRQALMESSLMAIGIWVFISYLNIIEKKQLRYAIMLGSLIGIGFFIKTTILLFAFSLGVLFIINFKDNIKNKLFLFHLIIAILISQIILVPLYAQQEFWSTLTMNSRFMFTISEVLTFPLFVWLKNATAIIEILFWQLTPIIFFSIFISLFYIFKNNHSDKQKSILIYIVSLLVIFILFTKNASTRYLVSLIPLLMILSAQCINTYFENKKIITILFLLIPISLALVQIINPTYYLNNLDKVTDYSNAGDYLYNWTAGKAAQDATRYVKNQVKSGEAVVAVRSDAGNPENTVFYSFNKNKNVEVIYFDQNASPQLKEYECIYSSIPFYFIARDNHLTNTERFWNEEKRFYNIENTTSVGVYKIKNDCIGSTLEIVK